MERDPTLYRGRNYPIQAEAAKRMWDSIPSSYPLMVVPDHPGPRPRRWRWIKRRRWNRLQRQRAAAKAWNFGALYGANVGSTA